MTSDGVFTSNWAAPCYFTVDEPQSVDAPQLGADVTISLSPPQTDNTLLVSSGPGRTDLPGDGVRFSAATTALHLSVTWPIPQAAAALGVNPGPAMSGTYTFQPVTSNVVSYHTFHARSVTGAGVVSGIINLQYTVDDAPLVSASEYPEMDAGGDTGTPGTFTFVPKSADVVGYAHYFNRDSTQTVDAGADGTASAQWTPDEEGLQSVSVFAWYADGTYSREYDYWFNVGPW